MDSNTIPSRYAFLAEEYRRAAKALDEQNFEEAWHHLERAHVVAQDRLGPHCVSHWRMLELAWRTRDWHELVGQIFRLFLAPIGNITGRLPTGNSGRSNVSAFARMEIEPEISRVLGQSPCGDERTPKNTGA